MHVSIFKEDLESWAEKVRFPVCAAPLAPDGMLTLQAEEQTQVLGLLQLVLSKTILLWGRLAVRSEGVSLPMPFGLKPTAGPWLVFI